jgi:hypothetical protein
VLIVNAMLTTRVSVNRQWVLCVLYRCVFDSADRIPHPGSAAWYYKFDDVYKSYLEAGGAKLSEEQVVIRFLSSLDGLRHRDMCINIENQRKLGTARPATLVAIPQHLKHYFRQRSSCLCLSSSWDQCDTSVRTKYILHTFSPVSLLTQTSFTTVSVQHTQYPLPVH